MAVTGHTVLAGGLDVANVDGFVPQLDNEFVLVTSSGCLSGAFGQTNLPDGYSLIHRDQQVRMVPGERHRADLIPRASRSRMSRHGPSRPPSK